MVEKDEISLPLDESSFLNWRHENVLQSELATVSHHQPSLFAHMIVLNRIFIDINDFHSLSVNITRGAAGPELPNQTIQSLAGRLRNWYASLPPQMLNTSENLRIFGSRGLGRIFVAVHMGYYHFGQLLFYEYLHVCQQSAAEPEVANANARTCKIFSSSLCDLVYDAHQTPGCKVLYTMVGHNLVVASTIQIHTLLFSDSDTEITEARIRLERNFEILLLLRNFWPVLEISFEAFRTFRQACRRNMETAFKMDDWMLRFLYGFANKVEDKEVYEMAAGGVWPVEGIGFSPSEWIDNA